jgi:sulfur transfer complex TusBCD TusB component (DsrH family)
MAGNVQLYLLRNTEARSCNHCCSGKVINITYSECVFVDLSMQHAMRMHLCHLWPTGSKTWFHIIL